ncbi:hypothetical protein ACYPKM_03020 [Pseudomonas aeruginosa]
MTFLEEVKNLISIACPAGSVKDRDVNIASRLYGWDGKGGCSLQQAGLEFNLTRERVRQISLNIAKMMEPLAKDHLKSVPGMMEYIHKVIPASATRIEHDLKDKGLGDCRIEGVIKADALFFKVGQRQHLRIAEEKGARYVTPPDMDGCASRISATAQKETTHLGVAKISKLLSLIPMIDEDLALAFIRDVIEARNDAHWLDAEHEWVWLSTAPRNRVVTCLEKMLSLFSSTSLEMIVVGVNRYFKKTPGAEAFDVPLEIVAEFVKAWGHATVSPAGIVRKNASFSFDKEPLDYELAIAQFILSKPEKMAREKELESAIVPLVDGKAHPKKFSFSIALNHSPLICKGEKRGEYITTGSV